MSKHLLNSPKVQLSFNDKLDDTNVADDSVKSIKDEIILILELQENENKDQVVDDLLENGRQSLIKYQDDIIIGTYTAEMNGNDGKLINLLKRYFQQQWETQYSTSNDWFMSFLKQYRSGEKYYLYELVLTRTAEYGNKYMKDCPILSIVIQLLFEGIDDQFLEETDVFDELWFLITTDGIESITKDEKSKTKVSDYIVGDVMNEQKNNKQSILFLALRLYYDKPLSSLLLKSGIRANAEVKMNALDKVAEHGLLKGAEVIQPRTTRNLYGKLLDNINLYLKLRKEEYDVQKCKIQDKRPESDESDDSNAPDVISDESDVECPRDTQTFSKDTIFISGLPSTMPRKHISHILQKVFDSVGKIKINTKTKKPFIELFNKKGDKSKLSGNARVTFEKEESITKAIEQYNGKEIPQLRNARIAVCPLRSKCKQLKRLPMSALVPASELQLVPEQDPTEGKNKIATKGTQGNRSILNDANGTGSIVSTNNIVGATNTQIFSGNTIFISGLPPTMPEQRLFDTLWDEFYTVGQIKINATTKKPLIKLFKKKDNKSELSGTATVTFEKEEATTKAIEKYNKKHVLTLNDARINVKIDTQRTPVRREPLPQVQVFPLWSQRGKDQPDGPVNVFWDIENVAIPFGQMAYNVARKLRQRLISDRNLAESTFRTYCDVTKLSQQHRRGLQYASVRTEDIVHTKGNDADKRIHRDLQLLKEQQKTPSTIVLISGDIDFIQPINELRFCYKHYVIVIHNSQAKTELLMTANEAIPWQEFTRETIRGFTQSPHSKALMGLNFDDNTTKTGDVLESTPSGTHDVTIAHATSDQQKSDASNLPGGHSRLNPYRSGNRKPMKPSNTKPVDKDDPSPDIVYIPDLPSDKNDNDLEKIIRSRLQDAHHIQVSSVKCFLDLGVVSIRLVNRKDKYYLVNILQSIVLFPKDGIKVTLTKKLEVTSYVVFDKNATLPNKDMLEQRWITLFSSSNPPQFQTLSIQFPNIIKVTSFSIEELQAVAKFRVFEVDGQIAHIHTHVQCSYLEELPHSKPTLDENRIFCFIATQLNMNDRARTDKDLCQEQANTLFEQLQLLPQPMKELKSQFYIQYDKQSSNAITLASDSLHKWISMTFLNINGQLVFKTADISSKLIIKPIPLDFPLNLIFDHPIFNQSIKTDVAKLIGEHLVVEINDKHTYDKCLKTGAFEVLNSGDRLTLRILPYATVENPDNIDINVENWYGTQMEKYKPDITQFDSRHPIFRYKWNSNIWLDQFMRNKKELEQITNEDERRQNDFIRRMLRVTVMLNTMAAMRKRKYILEDSSTKTEVLIDPPTPLVTILYNHQSKLTQNGQPFTPPFSSTKVRVLNEDCLISYNNLVSSGMKPLLLNMANAITPGGGYRKGDGAQEENIFRRSNYYMSLDFNMDSEQGQYISSKRNYCLPTGQISPLPVQLSLYPIDEYGAIYTSGITVFRGTEDQGYPFIQRPLYDVCGIATAAYRDPPIQKNKRRLTPQLAVGTRKKIETLFAIAYKHKHDSLVLSAFGCGAFKNPPEHIALIFKSVILQYAAFFKEIVFSVIDDHNTGGRLNPNGNFMPFQQVLDNYVAHSPVIPTVGMSLGPYRLVQSNENNNKTTNEQFVICDVPPCEKAAYCENLNDQNHFHTYSHPSLCPLGSKCNESTDDVHCQMFIHRRKCSKGGQCRVTDARHLTDFDHPQYCSEGGHCNNIKVDHLNLYRHVPICDKGFDCPLKLQRNAEHLVQFRHCQRPCEYGGNCIRFHDEKHIANEYHPFNQPCPYTPFSCEMYNKFLRSNSKQNKSKNQYEFDETQKHCYRYSHVCPWGRLCTDQSEEHLSMTIHIARQMCLIGNPCNQMMKEDHLDSFSHSNVPDIRFLCRYSGSECCDRLKPEHIIKYQHSYTLNYLGVAQYFALNKHINFIQNQSEMTEMICEYVKETCKQSSKQVFVSKDLLEWIGALQPVHRCNASIFESILVHGQLMSRSHMNRLENPIFVAHTIDQHERVRKILASQGPALQKDAREFIEALVRKEFDKTKNEELEYRIHFKEEALKVTLSKEGLDEIRLCTSEIVQASIKLHSANTGIGHEGDLIFGTNQQVFSTLGPNTASYYGDIVIVVKRDIMLHPDSNFTMQAATMYNDKTYKCRPWISDSGSEEGHVKQFHSTKLHCTISGYEYVTALELMAITGVQKKTMNVNLADIIYRWKNTDAHQVIEAHLPQLIPLRYIDHIYMPKNVFESLSPKAQKSARELFQCNLTITKHTVDLTIDLMAFSKPDDSRKDYHNYVINQILKSIERYREQNVFLTTTPLLTLNGMTITIPATNFENFITNPLTITQSYNQYLNQSKITSKSDDSIYIYWKAIRGDFMLILTNGMIEVGKVQPDLVYLTCYVAPFDTNTSSDPNYNERYTYINRSPPAAHQTVLEGQHFKVGSNTFHKGCNPDDYILYCLKLNPKKGQVSLMNAGVNGIYNRTILKCTFEQSELNLTSLHYVHVTAGRQSVSIRNLVISHELISDAHPKFDKEFVSRNMNNSHDHSQDNDVTMEETEDIDGQQNTSLLSPLVTWLAKKMGFKNKQQQAADNDDDHSEEELKPCKDSIYCLDQYSKQKPFQHNQTCSHPCNYFELCRNIHNMPHCRQFTHNIHDVSKCPQDTNCKQVVDPVHRSTYRHTNLPDILYPCRDQQQCQNLTFEHRKKYFHGEFIDLSSITKFQNSSYATISSDKLDKHATHVWSAEEEESDDEDLVSTFYNDAAGKSNITDARGYDQYGNATERIYDLGRDGAYKKYSILIAQFYDFDMQKPIDALKIKGFQVNHVKTEDECIIELDANRYQIAWIISTNGIKNSTFISSLVKFHSSGGAVFLFADNTPYVCHVSEFLKTKFGITLEGNYYGAKTLTYQENGYQQTGHYGQHQIFTGIANLFEGITICHPVYSTPNSRKIFVTIATATDGNSSIAVYDPPETSKEGRLCLDCGFTKLFCNWDSAGTARYIVNASCWLLGIEKRLKSKKKIRMKP